MGQRRQAHLVVAHAPLAAQAGQPPQALGCLIRHSVDVSITATALPDVQKDPLQAALIPGQQWSAAPPHSSTSPHSQPPKH